MMIVTPLEEFVGHMADVTVEKEEERIFGCSGNAQLIQLINEIGGKVFVV